MENNILKLINNYTDTFFIAPLDDKVSIIMLMFKYLPFERLPTKEYAQLDAYYLISNKSYHLAKSFIDNLQAVGFKACHTNNINYKKFAYKNNMCGVGKNTLAYIKGAGSRFVMQAVQVEGTFEYLDQDLKLQPDCDSCNRCQKACPVGAIGDSALEFRHTKCLRYLQEEGSSLNNEQIKAMQNKFLGCDICQVVCPYNKKEFKEVPAKLKDSLKIENLLQILTSKKRTKEVFEEILGANYIRSQKLKKQALIVAANSKNKNLIKYLKPYLSDKDIKIRDFAKEALLKISS